jgi:hypothetical protein
MAEAKQKAPIQQSVGLSVIRKPIPCSNCGEPRTQDLRCENCGSEIPYSQEREKHESS